LSTGPPLFSTGSGMVGIGEKVDGVVAAAVLGRSGGTSRVWLPPRLSSGQLYQPTPDISSFVAVI